MKGRCYPSWFAALLLVGTASCAAVISGPEPGKKLPALPVFAATGPHAGKDVDYVAIRGAQPTVYVLVREFDRPVARFLKTLDAAARDQSALSKDVQSQVVAAWLTDDKEKTKQYLPRVQQSLQFEATALAVFPGDKSGPDDWDVSSDARVTVVVARDGRARARFGFGSLNETDVPPVREALEKALKE